MISVCESGEVTEIAVQSTEIAIHTDSAADPVIVDLVAIATAICGLKKSAPADRYFPSPWTGLRRLVSAPAGWGSLGLH